MKCLWIVVLSEIYGWFVCWKIIKGKCLVLSKFCQGVNLCWENHAFQSTLHVGRLVYVGKLWKTDHLRVLRCSRWSKSWLPPSCGRDGGRGGTQDCFLLALFLLGSALEGERSGHTLGHATPCGATTLPEGINLVRAGPAVVTGHLARSEWFFRGARRDVWVFFVALRWLWVDYGSWMARWIRNCWIVKIQ